METTREKIINCGMQAIIGKSYNAVGLNEILAAAGVPKGSFYHFFKSKEDFCVAVVEQFSDQTVERMRTVLRDTSCPPLERLRRWFESSRDSMINHAFHRQCLMAKTALEMGSNSEAIRLALKDGMDRFRTLMAQCIQEGQTRGEISTRHDAEILADVVLNSWEGVLMRAQLSRDDRPIKNFLQVTLGEWLNP
jgi:TetR/AcrR family transcriptional regulator, transcriptional repressor for nem operon